MALNDSQTKVNFDAATDDPKVARGELATNVDIYNAMVTLLKTIATLNIGDGVKDDGAGNLGLDLGTNPGLEIIAAQLLAKVGPGNKLTASGIETDINGLTEDTSPDTVDDILATYDTSAGVLKKVKADKVGAGTSNVQVLTSNGTWIRPSGITTVLVIAIGGGGGGGDGGGSNTAGGGGGAGEYVYASVTVAGNVTVTCGTGGVGGNGSGQDGAAGGDTTFGSVITAKGGSGGTGSGGNTGGTGGTAGSVIGNRLAKLDGGMGDAGVDGGSGTGGDGGTNGFILVAVLVWVSPGQNWVMEVAVVSMLVMPVARVQMEW
jgi:hypothetical protein